MNNATSPGYYRIIEILATLFIPPLILFNTIYLSLTIVQSEYWWILLPAIVLGTLAGDMLTGLVHWFCDTFGHEDAPFFGPNIIKPFRDHHVDPQDITRHDFFVTNGNSCFLGAALNVPVLLVIITVKPLGLIISSALLFISLMSLAACLANQVHKLSHSKNPGTLATFLQRYHLILNPAMHAKHHAAPHLTNYCISFGWLNPFLDKIKFFRAAEYLLEKMGLEKTNTANH